MVEIERNPRLKLRIGYHEYNGKMYLSIREWYKDAHDDEWKAGKAGMNLPEDIADAVVPAIVTVHHEYQEQKKSHRTETPKPAAATTGKPRRRPRKKAGK